MLPLIIATIFSYFTMLLELGSVTFITIGHITITRLWSAIFTATILLFTFAYGRYQRLAKDYARIDSMSEKQREKSEKRAKEARQRENEANRRIKALEHELAEERATNKHGARRHQKQVEHVLRLQDSKLLRVQESLAHQESACLALLAEKAQSRVQLDATLAALLQRISSLEAVCIPLFASTVFF